MCSTGGGLVVAWYPWAVLSTCCGVTSKLYLPCHHSVQSPGSSHRCPSPTNVPSHQLTWGPQRAGTWLSDLVPRTGQRPLDSGLAHQVPGDDQGKKPNPSRKLKATTHQQPLTLSLRKSPLGENAASKYAVSHGPSTAGGVLAK